MSSEFDLQLISDLEAEITAYNAAILALTTVGIYRYTMDTGQNRTEVERNKLPQLRAAREAALVMLDTTRARCGDGGVNQMRPAF